MLIGVSPLGNTYLPLPPDLAQLSVYIEKTKIEMFSRYLEMLARTSEEVRLQTIYWGFICKSTS